MKLIKIIYCCLLLFAIPICCFAQSITFIPEVSSQDKEKISMQIVNDKDDELMVNIIATKFSKPVLGLSFDFLYNAEILQYKNYSPGSFLEQGGTPIYLIAQSPKDKSRLVAGISLKRGDQLPLESGTIVSLNFKILKSGDSKFNFQDVNVATLNTKKENLKNVAWTGGQASIQKKSGKSLYSSNLFNIPGGISPHWIFEGGLILLVLLILMKKKLKSILQKNKVIIKKNKIE